MNNIYRDNYSTMQLTNDNARFVNYLTGYLRAYAQAGIELFDMFEAYGEQTMTEDQQKLYNEMYSSFNEIVTNMRSKYLPK